MQKKSNFTRISHRSIQIGTKDEGPNKRIKGTTGIIKAVHRYKLKECAPGQKQELLVSRKQARRSGTYSKAFDKK